MPGKEAAALQDKLKERGYNYTPVTGKQKEGVPAHRGTILMETCLRNGRFRKTPLESSTRSGLGVMKGKQWRGGGGGTGVSAR